MQVNQIFNVVNNVTSQMTGESTQTVVDLTGLIALGDTVLSSDSTKDKFLNTLVDQIGKTIISNRAYSSDVELMLVEDFKFGAVLQKLYVELMPAVENDSWNLDTGAGHSPIEIVKPVAKQKLFSDINTWEVTVTITDHQLSSAFQSAEKMASFVDAIFTAMSNTMNLQLEGMGNMARANFIAERLIAQSTGSGKRTVVNLLVNYKATLPAADPDLTMTPQQALTNPKFLKYASREIRMTLKKMSKMTRLFNTQDYDRFTTEENANVVMLTDFSSSIATHLEADTYHKELVQLPAYSEISYWQSPGETAGADFATNSKINIDASSGLTVNQSGIVGAIFDRECMGITIMNRRMKSFYNPKSETTNYFNKADIGYFNDLSENGVIFVVTDTLAAPTLKGTSILNSKGQLKPGIDLDVIEKQALEDRKNNQRKLGVQGVQ